MVKKEPKEKLLSDAQIDEQIRKLEEKKLSNHLMGEEIRIEAVKCGNCGARLNLKSKDYMKLGNTRTSVECPKCEKLNDITVNYKVPPASYGKAKITQNVGGFKWEQRNIPIRELTDKQVAQWLDSEQKKIDDGTSRLSPEMQLIMRTIRK